MFRISFISQLAAAILVTTIGLSNPAIADFSGEFEEAQNAAEGVAKLKAADNVSALNKNAETAADDLETAGTVKTVADWVGVTATAATIGTELYDWGFVDDEKVRELDAEYRAAIDAGNNIRAEAVLKELNAINEKKAVVAKDQAGTQESLQTIQNVAGFANLGAATGSFAAAFMGYEASSALRNGSPDAKSKNAAKLAKDAANTSLLYGAGEAAAGLLSLHLAKKHGERADDLNSLADDVESDLPSDVRFDIDALFDQAAVTKCGSGAEYRVSNSAGATIEYDPNVARVAGQATSDETTYASVYNRIECLGTTVAGSDSGSSDGGTVTYSTPSTTDGSSSSTTSNGSLTAQTDDIGFVQCSSDVMACPDGSFVNRDPTNRCQFHSCASVARTADASGATVPDGARTLTSSGASRLQMDDVGAEIENGNVDVLKAY